MRTLRMTAAAIAVCFALAGCGGGGGGGGMTILPFNTGGNTNGGNPNNRDLSGQFAILGAAQGPTAHSVSAGTVTLDGNGNITAGSGNTFLFNNGTISTVASTVTSGTYNVDGSRNVTGSITSNSGGQTITTSTHNGRVSVNQDYVGANFSDSQGSFGVFALIKPVTNGSAASLNGTFRFSVAQVGTFQGFEFGNITFNGTGGITAGTTVNFSGGTSATVTGGTYSVASNGIVNGSVTLSNGSTSNFTGFLGQDGTLGGVLQDQNGDLGLGIATQGPGTPSSNADLNGNGAFCAVRTSPVAGGFITGSVTFNGNGGVTPGDVLTLSDGSTETTTGGSYNINADGTFSSATVTTSNGVTTTADFLTLGSDKTSLSGVIHDSKGNQGMVLLVK